MRYVQFQREVMGLERTEAVRVEVASRDGLRTREVSLPVASQSPTYGTWPSTQSRVLEGNIGYLRLPLMDGNAVNEVLSWMPKFRETRGLIVDVRGNEGGSRDALRALFPYVMAEGAAPRVVNAAKYRLYSDFREDHLGGSRYMYRESWEGWTPEERLAIAQFKQKFTPEWQPPADEFSDWHYLVMSRRTNPQAFVYGKPVIVLLDQKSFSATDIFVSAFKDYPQVATRLPVSGLSVNLASMASFQVSGQLHDGNGTEPDVIVNPAPEYFLRGGTDNILQEAISRLR
jgi:C-terminal processing protease CtpA/Prc